MATDAQLIERLRTTPPARRCASSTAPTRVSCSASRTTRSASAGWPRSWCRRSSRAPGATPSATTPTRASVRTWLYQIARHAIIDARRRAAVRPGLPLHEPGPGSEPVGESVEQAMLGWQVAMALERLSPDHRQMIRLAHVQGLTMREIAEHTDLPVGTVKSRTWYALRQLRLVLEEMGIR